MKILLIDPPYTIFTGYVSRYFPVGLSYIGAALKDNGYDVLIYDVDRERQDIGNLNFESGKSGTGSHLRDGRYNR